MGAVRGSGPGEPFGHVERLVARRRSVSGWTSGHACDSRDTMEFGALRDVIQDVETYPLSEVEEASDRTIDDEARFHVVPEP